MILITNRGLPTYTLTFLSYCCTGCVVCLKKNRTHKLVKGIRTHARERTHTHTHTHTHHNTHNKTERNLNSIHKMHVLIRLSWCRTYHTKRTCWLHLALSLDFNNQVTVSLVEFLCKCFNRLCVFWRSWMDWGMDERGVGYISLSAKQQEQQQQQNSGPHMWRWGRRSRTINFADALLLLCSHQPLRKWTIESRDDC